MSLLCLYPPVISTASRLRLVLPYFFHKALYDLISLFNSIIYSHIHQHSSKSITPAKLLGVPDRAILVQISKLPMCCSFCLVISLPSCALLHLANTYTSHTTLSRKLTLFLTSLTEISFLCIPKIKIHQAATFIYYNC